MKFLKSNKKKNNEIKSNNPEGGWWLVVDALPTFTGVPNRVAAVEITRALLIFLSRHPTNKIKLENLFLKGGKKRNWNISRKKEIRKRIRPEKSTVHVHIQIKYIKFEMDNS